MTNTRGILILVVLALVVAAPDAAAHTGEDRQDSGTTQTGSTSSSSDVSLGPDPPSCTPNCA